MRRAALAALGLWLLASPASATVRYASPTGVGSGSCDAVHPCTLNYAILGGSVSGDTLAVAGGTYTVTPLDLTKKLTITGGTAAVPRPVVQSTTHGSPVLTLDSGAAASTLTHLTLQAGVQDAAPLQVNVAATLSDLDLEGAFVACAVLNAQGIALTSSTLVQAGSGATTTCLTAIQNNTTLSGLTLTAANAGANTVAAQVGGNGTTLTDSTFSSPGSGTTALELEASGSGGTARRVTATSGGVGILLAAPMLLTDSIGVGALAGIEGLSDLSGPVQLRNDTGIGTGDGSAGIRSAQGAGGLPGGNLAVRNSIARGHAADLDAGTAANGCVNPSCPAGILAVDHSNFATTSGPVADNGANQSADPLFVDAAGLDFHLRRGSPAIDAAVADPSNGTTDRDGHPRVAGAAPDLGAYETDYPPAGGGSGGGGGGSSGAGGGSGGAGAGPGGTADTTAPVLSRASLTHPRFRVAAAGRAHAARRRHAPVGTVLRYTLSEAARVVVTIRRASARGTALGTLVAQTAAGARRLAFSGRLHRRALRPGRYRMSIVATDAAGNASRPVAVAFRVVRI
jgi:hypothetical protein